MKFNINNYKGNYVMHCKTEEEATDFCNYMHNIGRRWCSGESYLNRTCWDWYQKNTAYNFNGNSYANVKFYIENKYTILEWSDFMKKKEFTKADLKTGDIVMRRNGKVTRRRVC